MAKEKSVRWYWANLVIGGFLAIVAFVRTFDAAFLFKSMPGRYSPETPAGQSADRIGEIIGGLMMLGLSSMAALYGARGLRKPRAMRAIKEVDPAAVTSAKRPQKATTTDVFGIELSNRWLLVGALPAILFAIFVWPTLYRYDSLAMGGGSHFPVRINRITGSAERLGPSGWLEMESSERTKPNQRVAFITPYPEADMRDARIEGQWFKANFYNGFGETLIGIEYTITAKGQNGEIITRKYTRKGIAMPPNENYEFMQDVGLNDVELQSVTLVNGFFQAQRK